MFRKSTKSTIHKDHFGAGSIIRLGDYESYLVISITEKSVSTVCLTEFTLVPVATLQVFDPNHLTENEARELVALTVPNCAFSDVELHPIGIKCYCNLISGIK